MCYSILNSEGLLFLIFAYSYCVSAKFVFFFKFSLLPMLCGAIVLANRQLLLEVLKKIVHKTVLVVLVLGADETNSGHKTFSDIF